jgi:hypothetical protein
MGKFIFALGLASALFVSVSTLVHAQTSANTTQTVSTCKGKVEAECKTTASCVWVNGYKTVAELDRKGYCRVSTRKAR